MSALQDFIISRVRVKLIKQFLTSPAELHYVRELTRATSEEINAVRRELLHMQKVGMLESQKRGNRVYFWFNKKYRFYEELLSLVSKTTGLGLSITKNQQRLGKISFAMISGRYVRRMPALQNQVDLLIVGDVIIPQLAVIVKTAEGEIGREINYSIMSLEELTFRKHRRDPFLLDVLRGSRIMLIGDEEDFVA